MAHKYGTGRDALLQAVVRIVARKGLRGLTYRAVAAEAGVNNSLVAHHFGTRDALITEALEWSVARSIDETKLVEFGTSEAEFLEALLGSVAMDPDLQAFQFEMILESRRRPELVEPVRRLYESYNATLRESIRHMGLADIDAAQARALFAALDGLILQYVAGLPRAEVEAAVRALWNLIVALRTGDDAELARSS